MESKQEPIVSMEDCLKLLKGQRDEQRFAGLVLITKICKGDDLDSLRKVYDAVGVQFLNRLLLTGMGKGVHSTGRREDRDAYLRLSVTVLAAFCRVPEIASSEDMVSKVPLILEIMSKESDSPILEGCYEVLYLVSSASECGMTSFYKSGGIKIIASQMLSLPDGSHMMELAMGFLQLMLSKQFLGILIEEYLSEFTIMVATIARQFAVLNSALKFEALHLLSSILSSKYSARLHNALRVMPNNSWSDHMRSGIVTILQNRVVPAEKHQALTLADSMTSIMGERWLIGPADVPDTQNSIPSDRCLWLVLETSRVELSVLLNEIAYSKFGAAKDSSSNETTLQKNHTVAVAYCLLEKIIKLISDNDGNEGNQIDESTSIKVINGLNETIGIVLDYLQDAKEHGQKKGNDILASVRLIGSYLAEAPIASKDKVRELLGYMLSIEGEDESSSFSSVIFLLPVLSQMTMNTDGCKALVSSGGHGAVVQCLTRLIGPNEYIVEDHDCIFLACDTVLNLLLQKEQVWFSMDEFSFVDLLKALAYWADTTSDPSVVMMASCICSLILDYMSEETLLNHPNYDGNFFNCLSQLLRRSLAFYGQDDSDDAKKEADLLKILTAAYSRWADRYPYIREAVEK